MGQFPAANRAATLGYTMAAHLLADPATESTLAQRPTRARWTLLFWLCTLALLLYVDRVCIGQAATAISRELHLTKKQLSWVFGAFTLAYCLFEVPTGHWGDRYGARRVITRVVLWWTAFTAMTGLAWNAASLVVMRFLFGAGEAGALPNVARVITRWYPAGERGRVRGAVMTVSFLGAAVAPIFAAALIETLGWRQMFLLLGVVGVAWAWGFYRWFRDDPATHPQVNSAELACIRGTDGLAHSKPAVDKDGHRHTLSWARVLTSMNTWLMGGIMTVVSVLFYTVFQWFPTYFKEARHASELVSGSFTSVVMASGAAGCILGGWFIDWINRCTPERVWVRRLNGSIPLAASGLCVGALSRAASDWQAMVFCAAALFFTEFAIPNWWTVVAEISGRHGAALWGLMNSMGGLGVIVFTLLVGDFVESREKLGAGALDSWNTVFLSLAAVLGVGSLFWLCVHVGKPIAEGDAQECPS